MLCAKQHNFDDCVALAHRYSLGIEVQTFAYPNTLDGDWEGLLNRYRAVLRGIPGEIAMHGPFMDMASGSPDPLIMQAVRRRVRQALHIAEELRARTVIFHANFLAMLRNQEYRDDWTERQIAFWAPLAQEAWEAGVVIALENMWEFEPTIIGDVLRRVELPGLKACIDIGHVQLFSEVGLEQWLTSLDGQIVHVHMNNNGGVVDEHHALDEGVINYRSVLARLRRLARKPTFALEIEQVDDIRRSLTLLDLPGA